MFQRRAVLGALLIGFAAAGRAGAEADGPCRFIAPVDGDVVAGDTTFQFAAGQGAVDRIDLYVRGRLVGSAAPPNWVLNWEAPLDLQDTELVALCYAAGEMSGRTKVRTAAGGFGEVIDVVGVDLFPVVLDRRGRYIRHLKAEDFTVFEDGHPVELESFERTARGLNLVVVLDVSGSMEGQIDLVKAAAAELVDWLEADDRVAVYSFNHLLNRVAQPGDDKRLAQERIRGLAAGGGTALYDALLQVIEEFPGRAGRTVLVVFSDGRDERSLVPLSRVIQRAREMRVAIYTVASDRKQGAPGRGDLEQITAGTGGVSFTIRNLSEISAAFRKVFADLGAQYRLSYTPTPGAPGVRRIEVRLSDPRLTVRCRESYHYGH